MATSPSAPSPSAPSPSAPSPSASSSTASSTPPPPLPYTPTNLPIGQPLTLLLPIIPGTDPQLIFDAFQKNAQTIGMALNEMQLVHYLRLLVLDRSQPNLQLTATPNLDTLVLAVITNYDNSFEFYIQQFAQHLGAFYTEVLQYIVGGSAVGDVTNNQQAFIDFVKSHDASQPTNTPPPPPSLSAYPSLQVPTIWSNAGWAFPTSPPSTTTTASPATPSATAAGS